METKLEIDVARLEEDGETCAGELDDAYLDLNDPFVKPFAGTRYDLFVQRLGTELLVRGTLSQDFDAVCSRCGGDFDFTLTVDDFTTSIEVDEKTQFVDLTDEVRQSIILALPTYPLCRTDCQGVCTTCGKNLNEGPCSCGKDAADERWSGLAALKF